MILGYAGPDPGNERTLTTIVDASWGPLSPRAGLPHRYASVAAPTVTRLASGALVGVAGRFLPHTQHEDDVAREVGRAVEDRGPGALVGVDGQWAIALHCADGRVVLAHDPFGAYQLSYAWVGQTLWFSSSFRALLAVPEIRRARQLDLAAVHGYLALSFVPAPRTLFQGIQSTPPATALTFDLSSPDPGRAPLETPLFPPPSRSPDQDRWTGTRWREELGERIRAAIRERLPAQGGPVAVLLSGGLDSSAIAAGLAAEGVRAEAFHLDFGLPFDDERPFAEEVAARLSLPFNPIRVPSERDALVQLIRQAVQQMDQPFGDPAAALLWVGSKAIADRGSATLFNGEGGDQLFAGWPNKAMLAAELFGHGGDHAGSYDRAGAWLRSFHHCYDPEIQRRLYGDDLARAAGQVDLRREASTLLDEAALPGLFERLRWANYWTKGAQNILPRAAAMVRAAGLVSESPLFDLDLASFALTIPGPLLLNAARDKDLFKRLLESSLPRTILERPKRGMGVPATVWCLGPMRREVRHWVGKRLLRRGFFQRDYVRSLLDGIDLPGEVRARRVGEKLWLLLTLELWLEHNLDT